MYYRSSSVTGAGGLSAPPTDPMALIQRTLAAGQWMVALGVAFALGERDESRLTNLLFFARHPERKGRKLDPGEPGFQALSREWLQLRDGYVRPFLRKISASAGGPSAPGKPTPPSPPPHEGPIRYATKAGYYGPVWKRKGRAPDGLPAWARTASETGAALPHVRRLAGEAGVSPVFVSAVAQMAKTESAATFARPADGFDARPPHLRPAGKSLITAWGVFQFNRDAWTSQFTPAERRLPRRSRVEQGERGCSYKGGCVMPWDCTPEEELAIPIRRYARLFREATSQGGSDLDAARGLRIWHIKPAAHRKWLDRARAGGFVAAWAGVDAKLRKRVDQFLRKAEIIT